MNEQVLEDFLLDKIGVNDFVTKIFEKSNLKDEEFNVTLDHLLKLCEHTINGKIDIGLLENLSNQIIFSDYFCWDNETADGEIVSETLFDWGNPAINFPINDLNLRLWRDYLKTGDYRLKDFNNWNTHIDRQKEICKKVNADWRPVNPKHKIGISADLDGEPIHGLRHQPEKGTTGWYIWTGDYSAEADFFKSMHAGHLLEKRPDLIKYLGLPPGYRFLIDQKGYEDIWEDKELLDLDSNERQQS